MKDISLTKFALIAGAMLLTAFLIFQQGVRPAFASAPSGLPATVATTSQQTVVPGSLNVSNFVFATSSCSARIVTTLAAPVMIGFSDRQGFTPTALLGHVQAASTTVAYDSGIYGCEAMRIYSFSTSTITVTETR